ncbi:MAG: DUF3883 domain-containing protein [Bacteroidales bacterium]|nr:DUF3883 domain-containing protein [Bacteroidales bacterium]
MANSWSNIEVELIVTDYFIMLVDELLGKQYSKAEHRRNRIPLLQDRSEGSIEFKHQNISAVLIKLGQPYIKGYLPRYNYQKILEEKVIEYLALHQNLEVHFQNYVEKEIIKPQENINFQNILVDPPISQVAAEPIISYQKSPIKINYLEKEQSNKNLGIYGEELIMEYEKLFLINSGKEKLAEKIIWISKEEGDGAGFDILSRNLDGTDKYIEVKTTRLGKETPFFFTKNESDFSDKHFSNYNYIDCSVLITTRR